MEFIKIEHNDTEYQEKVYTFLHLRVILKVLICVKML